MELLPPYKNPGLVATAKHELRNLRRSSRGLPPLAPGEESEDDEILNKSDFEAYEQGQITPARDAMSLMRSPSAPNSTAAAATDAIKSGGEVV